MVAMVLHLAGVQVNMPASSFWMFWHPTAITLRSQGYEYDTPVNKQHNQILYAYF
jgi:hypothetical protein